MVRTLRLILKVHHETRQSQKNAPCYSYGTGRRYTKPEVQRPQSCPPPPQSADREDIIVRRHCNQGTISAQLGADKKPPSCHQHAGAKCRLEREKRPLHIFHPLPPIRGGLYTLERREVLYKPRHILKKKNIKKNCARYTYTPLITRRK